MLLTLELISNLLLCRGLSGKDKNTTAHFPQLNKNYGNCVIGVNSLTTRRARTPPQAAQGSLKPALPRPSALRVHACEFKPPRPGSPCSTAHPDSSMHGRRPHKDTSQRLTNIRTWHLQIEPKTPRSETSGHGHCCLTANTVLSEGQPHF